MTDPLTLSITYDHAAGNYTCALPSGARFTIERRDVNGRLEANLDLYRRACISQQKGPRRFAELDAKMKERAALQELCEGVEPTVHEPGNKPRNARVTQETLSLEELGL